MTKNYFNFLVGKTYHDIQKEFTVNGNLYSIAEIFAKNNRVSVQTAIQELSRKLSMHGKNCNFS